MINKSANHYQHSYSANKREMSEGQWKEFIKILLVIQSLYRAKKCMDQYALNEFHNDQFIMWKKNYSIPNKKLF